MPDKDKDKTVTPKFNQWELEMMAKALVEVVDEYRHAATISHPTEVGPKSRKLEKKCLRILSQKEERNG